MKTQLSRFRMISLFLLCAFLAAAVYCAGQPGILPSLLPETANPAELSEPSEPSDTGVSSELPDTNPLPEGEAGSQPVSEESLNQSEPVPGEAEVPSPAPSDEPLFNTTGL